MNTKNPTRNTGHTIQDILDIDIREEEEILQYEDVRKYLI